MFFHWTKKQGFTITQNNHHFSTSWQTLIPAQRAINNEGWLVHCMLFGTNKMDPTSSHGSAITTEVYLSLSSVQLFGTLFKLAIFWCCQELTMNLLLLSISCSKGLKQVTSRLFFCTQPTMPQQLVPLNNHPLIRPLHASMTWIMKCLLACASCTYWWRCSRCWQPCWKQREMRRRVS